jgi:hypothetical protein
MMGLEEEKELISFFVLITNIPLFQSSNNPVIQFGYSNILAETRHRRGPFSASS